MSGALPDPAALRAEALARCGSRAAYAALDAGELLVVENGAPWESSHGSIQGLLLRLGVGPATLGALSRVSAGEALYEAVAGAVARFEGVSMRGFECRWAFADDPPEFSGGAIGAPYRGGDHARPEAKPGDPVALRAAVLAYVRARGEETELPPFAWTVRAAMKPAANVDAEPRPAFASGHVVSVRIGVPRAVATAARARPELAVLTHALEELFVFRGENRKRIVIEGD